jgi:hypothetical protein
MQLCVCFRSELLSSPWNCRSWLDITENGSRGPETRRITTGSACSVEQTTLLQCGRFYTDGRSQAHDVKLICWVMWYTNRHNACLIYRLLLTQQPQIPCDCVCRISTEQILHLCEKKRLWCESIYSNLRLKAEPCVCILRGIVPWCDIWAI